MTYWPGPRRGTSFPFIIHKCRTILGYLTRSCQKELPVQSRSSSALRDFSCQRVISRLLLIVRRMVHLKYRDFALFV
jgi:hypothetical protein